MANVTETTDAAAGVGTSYSLSAGQTAQGTIATAGDRDWYAVSLTKNQTYTVALVGTGAANLQNPILRLYRPNGTLITLDDDAFIGENAIFTFTASANGTFYLEAAASNGSDTGQYGLAFGTAAKPVFDEAMGGGSLDSDSSWSAPGAPATITYGFRQSAPGYTYDVTINNVSVNVLATFARTSDSNVQAAIRSMIQGFQDVAGLTFVDVNPSGYTDNATILIGDYTNANDGAGAFAYSPGPTASADSAGDMWLNRTAISGAAIGLGSYSYWAVMHELGHALGLSHPGAYNAGPGVTLTYGNAAQFQQDSSQYSIMSYFDESNTGGQLNGDPSGLQLYDIYELQRIYGVNTTTRTGADTYGFNTKLSAQFDLSRNPNAGYAIWDAGGVDTIDASLFGGNQRIDLGQGRFSNIGTGIGNLAIAFGAVIEDAVGGSGVDTIIGNDVDNRLEGGAGGDTIDGGGGRDTVSYHGSSAAVDVDLSRLAPGPGQYLPRGGDAQGDTLISIENIIGSAHDDRLLGVAFGAQGSEMAGGWGNDTIFGTAGDDVLHGGGINLVRNGSFELNGTLTAGSAGYFLAGSVDSWTVQAGAAQIELFTSASGSTPKTGQFAADLSAAPGKTTIAQTVQGLEDGVLYRLAFDARRLSGSGAKVEISFDGVACGTITPGANWGTYFVDVYGNRGSGPNRNLLTFKEVGGSDFDGTHLDNIRLFDASLSDPIYDGNDLLISNGGNDVAYGDGGDDNFWANGVPTGVFTQQYDGGAGTDKLTMDWSAATWAVRYMASNTLLDAPVIGDAAAYATGETFGNKLYFRDVEVFDLTGGANADLLVGGARDDLLNGGDGNDVLIGNGGVDVLNGGLGIDKAILDTTTLGGVRIVLADLLGGGSVVLSNGTRLTSIEAVELAAGDGDDYLDVRGTVAYDPVTPWTTAQSTTFAGRGGNDTLAVDLATSWSANFDGGTGDGDLLVMDWSAAVSSIDLYEAGTASAHYASYAWTYIYQDPQGNQFATEYYFTAGFTDVERFDLTGGRYADKLYGGSGDDVLNGGSGYFDSISGGAGVDTLKVRWAGGDFGYGTHAWGGDAAAGYSGTYTAFRTDRNEVRFTGVEKFDLVLGEGGDDIRTGDYDDIVVGNGGNDTFRTGKGADNVSGGDGADRWSGDKSNATAAINIDLTAVSQSTYKIGSVNATVTGIEALGGSDADGDRFATGSGKDVLVTRSDFYADYIETNGGNDTVTVAGGYADIVLMGGGMDTLKVRWAGGDFGFGTAGWLGNAAGGYSGTYTAFRTDRNEVRFTGVEKFDLVLGEGSDDIRTGDYDDIVVGNGGNDTFRTGKGADNVSGGDGADRWSGDKSNATAAIDIDLLVTAQSSYVIGNVTATVTGIEALGGSDAANDRFATGSGDDAIVTRSEFYADYIETNGGNDTVTVAGGYADIVLMGSGLDTLKVRWASGGFGFGTAGWGGNATDGYSGTYTAFRTDQNEVRFTGVEKFDLVLGEGGDDIRTGDYDDIVVGNGGNDTFRTGKGADNVNGGGGADRWSGDKSNATAAINVDLLVTAQSTYVIGNVTATVTGIEALGGSDAANDRFATGSGNDAIVTRSEFYADYIETNSGNDTVTVAGGYADIVLMGAGVDTLKVRWAGGDFGYGTHAWGGDAAAGYSGTYTAFRTDRNEVRFTGVEKFDLVLGEGGDDIRTGDYDDIVVGNGGNDTFRTGKGADNVSGGDGADRWSGDKSNATAAINIDLTAVSQSTYKIGSVNATVTGIEALGGSDADGDRFATGSGKDVLVTRSDFYADYIETNGGNDTVTVAGGYADIVLMGGGMDTLKVRWAGGDFGFGTAGWLGNAAGGYSGTYTAFRTDRNEVRFTGVEKFDLVLGEGGDAIRTGDYDDVVAGNGGNDTFRTGKGADAVDGGNGVDRWQADKSNSTAAFTIDLNAASQSTYRIGKAKAKVMGIEVLGGSNDDGDRFATGSGKDVIVTRSEFLADYIETNDGNDTVTVAGGYADVVLMGSGFDTLVVRWAGGDLGYGTVAWGGDLVGGYSGTYTAFRTDRNEVRFAGVDKFDLVLGDGGDDIRTGDNDDKVSGQGGGDRLNGGGGNDELWGDAGSDTLLGGAGNDQLDGGTGVDSMFGGAGNDTYFVDNAADVVREDSVIGVDDGGFDTVYSSASFILGSFLERLLLTGGDAIDGTGNELANTLAGNGGINHLFGGGGDDTLDGGAGADILDGGEGSDTYNVDKLDTVQDTGTAGTDQVITNGSFTLSSGSGIERLSAKAGTGGNFVLVGDEAANKITGNMGSNALRGMAGNDTLLGDDGDDKLTGGLGRDTMTGGNGADSFIFSAGDSPASLYDTITDFVSGLDMIDLPTVGGGGLAASAFAAISVASDNFNNVFSAATAAMSGGDKSAVFVAGVTNGWLLWNTDSNLHTPDEGVRLIGGNSLAAFARTDIV
ncbi:MAG: M10 family metallopeptidase C-terminal domain-containing protein [Enhydrobacter sp.]|nr:M10 family metallopeptidase C-terminal domain-containing protein [Enhydrobacter sp.]